MLDFSDCAARSLLLEHAAKKTREWKSLKATARERVRIVGIQNSELTQLFRVRINSALRGVSKNSSVSDLLGCTVEEAWSHLEKQFRPGMTLENHGPVWHIDHIRPCASFDLSQPEQQRQCFHFSNLQPLFVLDNLRKGAKYSPLT